MATWHVHIVMLHVMVVMYNHFQGTKLDNLSYGAEFLKAAPKNLLSKPVPLNLTQGLVSMVARWSLQPGLKSPPSSQKNGAQNITAQNITPTEYSLWLFVTILTTPRSFGPFRVAFGPFRVAFGPLRVVFGPLRVVFRHPKKPRPLLHPTEFR